MKQMFEKLVGDYEKHSDIFANLGPVGYTVAINMQNLTPQIHYSTLPDEWSALYVSNSLSAADPVVDFLLTSTGVTRWSEIKHSRGPSKTSEFLELSGGYDLKFGAAVVRRNPKKPQSKSIVSVGRADRELNFEELEALALSFDQLLVKVDLGGKVSARQIKTLELMASGLNRHDCANQLGCSPDTIKRDVQMVRKLLGAKTTTEAVAIATWCKLIAPVKAQFW